MGRTISIFSPKGGVGKTFITTNLAVSLSQKVNDKKILLIDMDLDFPGDMAKLLKLSPKKALVDISPEWEKGNYSPEQIEDCVLPYSDNLDFLPIILNPQEKYYAKEKFLASALKDLKEKYEFIIADTGISISRRLISFFENTNLILIVVNPDLLSIHKIKESIKKIQSLSFPLKMIKLVLNRAESLGGVAWQEVKVALSSEILAHIPSQGKSVCSSINRQIPLIIDNPRSQASIILNKLAQKLLDNPQYFIASQELEQFLSDSPKNKSLIEEEIPVGTLDLSPLRKMEKRDEKINKLKKLIHRKIIQEIDFKQLNTVISDEKKIKKLYEKTKITITNALAEETGVLITSREERELLIKEVLDETFGIGPLQDLINDPEITDIMVNNSNHIYVEKKGRLELTSKKFSSNTQVRQIIERILAPLGRRIDESVPMVDARLADGSRVNAIIPPLSLTGPTLTIRKFGTERLTIPDLIKLNTLNDTMAEFLKACVLTHKNIIVSGGTGSGKTTILNILSEFIPQEERLVTIEDAAELKLQHDHWIRLESRPSNVEGKGSISSRDLFKNSLRMRPDRIIIGECRGPESLDMLQAMNTGHDGSMTTIHANSTQDVLSRLDSLILMSGIEIPLRAIREMIASAIDIIVHTSRMTDGSRKIVQITEVTGMLDELHIGLKDIFVFNQSGIDNNKVLGEFQPTKIIPTFFDGLQNQGVTLSKDIFKV